MKPMKLKLKVLGFHLLHVTSPKALYFIFIISIFFCVWWYQLACRVLVPQPGIEPKSPTVEVQSLNHWTIREFPSFS